MSQSNNLNELNHYFLVQLRDIICKHFSLSELETLTFDIGIDFDEIAKTSKTASVTELIRYSKRREKLHPLVSKVLELRPNLSSKAINHTNEILLFAEEGEEIYQLIFEKSPFLPHLLVSKLLRNRLGFLIQDSVDVNRGFVYRQSKILSEQQFKVWMTQKIQDIYSLIQYFKIALNEELSYCMNLEIQPGTISKIKRAVDKIAQGFKALLEWELDVRFTNFPKQIDSAREAMQNMTKQIREEVALIPKFIKEEVNTAINEGSTHIDLNLQFNVSPQAVDLADIIEELIDKGFFDTNSPQK